VVISTYGQRAIIAKEIKNLDGGTFLGRPRLVVFVEIASVDYQIAVPFDSPRYGRPKAANAVEAADVPARGVQDDPARDGFSVAQVSITQMADPDHRYFLAGG